MRDTSKVPLAELVSKSAHVIKAARHADLSTSVRNVHLSNRHLKQELEDVFN